MLNATARRLLLLSASCHNPALSKAPLLLLHHQQQHHIIRLRSSRSISTTTTTKAAAMESDATLAASTTLQNTKPRVAVGQMTAVGSQLDNFNTCSKLAKVRALG